MNNLLKDWFKILCVLFAVTGMVSTCSTHRNGEEISWEMEESEVEDLLTKREECVQKTRNANRVYLQKSVNKRSAKAGSAKRADRRRINGRELINGTGAYLIL